MIVIIVLSGHFVASSLWNSNAKSFHDFLKNVVGRGESEISRAKALKNFRANWLSAQIGQAIPECAIFVFFEK